MNNSIRNIEIAKQRINEFKYPYNIQKYDLDKDLELADSILEDKEFYRLFLSKLSKSLQYTTPSNVGLIGLKDLYNEEEDSFKKTTFSLLPNSKTHMIFLCHLIEKYQTIAPIEALSLSLHIPPAQNAQDFKTKHIIQSISSLITSHLSSNREVLDLIKEGIHFLQENQSLETVENKKIFNQYICLLLEKNSYFEALNEVETLPIENSERNPLINLCLKKLSNHIKKNLLDKNLLRQALDFIKVSPKELPGKKGLIRSFMKKASEKKEYLLALELLSTIEQEYPNFSLSKPYYIECLINENAFEKALEILSNTPNAALEYPHFIKTCCENLISHCSYAKAAEGINLLKDQADFAMLTEAWKSHFLISEQQGNLKITELNEIPPNFCFDNVREIYLSCMMRFDEDQTEINRLQLVLDRIRKYPKDESMILIGLNALSKQGSFSGVNLLIEQLPDSFTNKEAVILNFINTLINTYLEDLKNGKIEKHEITKNTNYMTMTINHLFKKIKCEKIKSEIEILNTDEYYKLLLYFAEKNDKKLDYEEIKTNFANLLRLHIKESISQKSHEQIFTNLIKILQNLHPITCFLEGEAFFYCLKNLIEQFPNIQTDLTPAQFELLSNEINLLFDECTSRQILDTCFTFLKKHNYPQEQWENLQEIIELTIKPKMSHETIIEFDLAKFPKFKELSGKHFG